MTDWILLWEMVVAAGEMVDEVRVGTLVWETVDEVKVLIPAWEMVDEERVWTPARGIFAPVKV